MTTLHNSSHRTAAAASLLIGIFFCFDTRVEAQAPDTLTQAKAAYASAAFEDALALLSSLHDTASLHSSEAGAYEAFCLAALGRDDDARRAVETVVRNDPEYRLSVGQAPPRMQALFDTVRARLLPEIARTSYASGRAAFDRKEFGIAVKDFGRTVALIDDLKTAKTPPDPGLLELLPLAAGFKDLAMLSAAPPSAPPAPVGPALVSNPQTPAPPPLAVPAATTESAAVQPAPSGPRTYGPEDSGVKAPVLIAQPMPPWQPETPAERATQYHAYISLVIDDRGRVESATLLGSLHKRYDKPLLETVPRWTFRPAMKDGVAVRYRYLMLINLSAK